MANVTMDVMIKQNQGDSKYCRECKTKLLFLPRGMIVIRVLSVLLNLLCSSSRAEIIFSIWTCLSGPTVPGRILVCPALMLAVIVLVVVLSVFFFVPSTPDDFILRSHCFRYLLGFRAEDFSGTVDE